MAETEMELAVELEAAEAATIPTTTVEAIEKLTSIKQLARSTRPSSLHPVARHCEQARNRLVEYRTSKPDYRPPESQKRAILWSGKKKEEAKNTRNWVFTKYEVANVFDKLVSQSSMVPAVEGYALLDHTVIETLEHLWLHLDDPDLETKSKRSSKTDFTPKARISWLDQVTRAGCLDWMRLMLEFQIGQEAKNRAFTIALSIGNLDAMELCLMFGAAVTEELALISKGVELRDADLVCLLLSAGMPAMSIDKWRFCMQPLLQLWDESNQAISMAMLSAILKRRPDVYSSDLLLRTLGDGHIGAASVVLTSLQPESKTFFRDVRWKACDIVLAMPDAVQRASYMAMLEVHGLLGHYESLQRELVQAVIEHRYEMVKVLVKGNVFVDATPHNAMRVALEELDVKAMDELRPGRLLYEARDQVRNIPSLATESQMLQFLWILGSRGDIHCNELYVILVRAVARQERALVKWLVQYKVSLAYGNGLAVGAALSLPNLEILQELLTLDISAEMLSRHVPAAMGVRPRQRRLRVFKAILEKGVDPSALVKPLRQAIDEAESPDIDLIKLLLKHNAPTEVKNEDLSQNPVLKAIKMQNIPLLKIVCEPRLSSSISSLALEGSFNNLSTWGTDRTVDILSMFLKRSAEGAPLHRTLAKAAQLDNWIAFVPLLLEHLADPNHDDGAAFARAVEKKDTELMDTLCMAKAPGLDATKALLPRLIHPDTYDLITLKQLFKYSSASAPAIATAIDPSLLKGNDNLTAILPQLLQHGLDVNMDDGWLLCLAVDRRDANLLRIILDAIPSKNSLARAFEVASGIDERSVQLQLTSVILAVAGKADIGQSAWLIVETQKAIDGDRKGLQMLLSHHVDIDHDKGAGLKLAATSYSILIVGMLMDAGPSAETIRQTILAVASSETEGPKQPVLEMLLQAYRGHSNGMATLLSESVLTNPENVLLPEVLFAHDIQPDVPTLETALQNASRDVFELLVNRARKHQDLVILFEKARKAKMPSDRRYWVYNCLLSYSMNYEDVTDALDRLLKSNELGDLSLFKLLLEHGALIYKGDIMLNTLKANNLTAIKLVTQYFFKPEDANQMFNLALQAKELTSDNRVETYRRLLQYSVGGFAITEALYTAVLDTDTPPKLELIELLIAKGAYVTMNDARCCSAAAQANNEDAYRAVAAHVSPDVLLTGLLKFMRTNEDGVVKWFKIAMSTQPKKVKIKNGTLLLLEVMKVFPHGTALLRVLLKYGISHPSKIKHQLHKDWAAEMCSVLLVALTQPVRIGNEPLLLYLEMRGRDALPAFATEVRKVSAALVCLLDDDRTPVLKALLELDRDEILMQPILGSSFVPLATAGRKAVDDDGDDSIVSPEMTLRMAAIYLGNFDGFRAINMRETPDDGTLHLCSLLALPKFVSWLISEGHDPMYETEEFDFMIPITLACAAQHVECCKVANSKQSMKMRRDRVIALLAPKTALDWKSNRMSVLHFALDAGIDITQVILKVFGVETDIDRDERYDFVDKAYLHYSPDQYVHFILDASADDKTKLKSMMQAVGFQTRYYNGNEATIATQPTGFTGMPPEVLYAYQSTQVGKAETGDNRPGLAKTTNVKSYASKPSTTTDAASRPSEPTRKFVAAVTAPDADDDSLHALESRMAAMREYRDVLATRSVLDARVESALAESKAYTATGKAKKETRTRAARKEALEMASLALRMRRLGDLASSAKTGETSPSPRDEAAVKGVPRARDHVPEVGTTMPKS